MPHALGENLTATEVIVAPVWAKELAVAEVLPESDFFEMGGDSLSMLNVLFQVAELLGVDVAPGALFDDPTLRGFCKKVDLLRAEASDNPIEARTTEGII
jgi:acyl carrier protein